MKSFATRLFSIVTIAATLAGGGGCAADTDSDAESSESAETAGRRTTANPVSMTDAERADVVTKKATCPFVGAAVWMKKLDVLNAVGNPLARISDIAALGDEGGGNLGAVVLKLFATGNHHRMHDAAANVPGAADSALTEEVLPGTFSLDFPKAQGSHPGHSGILEQGPTGKYHGGMDRAAFGRLLGSAVDVDGRKAGDRGFKGAKYLKRSDIGAFVWKNVSSDPDSKYLFHGFGSELLSDLRALHRSPSVEKIVKLTGTNNLVGSAGEFGLLVTMLEQPDKEIDGEPVIAVDDVNLMFVDKKLPADWNSRPKTAARWVINTMAILSAAEGDRFRNWL